MEKQSLLAYHVKRVTQPSLGMYGILREAFKTSIRNGKIVFFIMFIMFSYYTLMGFTDYFVLPPIFDDFQADSKLYLPQNGTFADADPALSKAVMKALRSFVAYQFVVLSFSCLVLMFSIVASVHSTLEAYTAKVLSLREMLLGTGGKWRRALKTCIWIIIISLGCAALLVFGLGIVGVMTNNSVSPSVLNFSVLILGGGFTVYLCSLWMLALVVSVVEDKFSGLKAINQANELMKGKRLQGFLLMLKMFLVRAALSTAFYILATLITPAGSQEANSLGMVVGFAISVAKNLSYCVLKLFVFVVYTLFYTECKKSHSVEKEEEKPAISSPISAVDEV